MIINKKQNAPTLCEIREVKIIPLNSAQDARPNQMKKENTVYNKMIRDQCKEELVKFVDESKILLQIEENKKKPRKVSGFSARLQKAMEQAEKQKRLNSKR